MEPGATSSAPSASAPRATRPVFVGIARSSAVTAYLGGVRRAEVRDIAPWHVSYDVLAGGRPSAPPGSQSFWAASVTGSGEQVLDWKPSAGTWRLVVMNAGGSPRVAVDASVGAKLANLIWVGAGTARRRDRVRIRGRRADPPRSQTQRGAHSAVRSGAAASRSRVSGFSLVTLRSRSFRRVRGPSHGCVPVRPHGEALAYLTPRSARALSAIVNPSWCSCLAIDAPADPRRRTTIG